MLSIGSDYRTGRRDFLRVGGMSLGGVSLANLATSPAEATQLAKLAKGKSVVFLFLHGGPSQIETFDPKMTAPPGIRSVTGEIKTKIPGVTFGSSFPRLAQLNDQFSIVRSFTTGDGNHDIKPVVGRDSFGANLGSIYSRIAGTSDPTSGLPTNIALFPRAVHEATQKGTSAFGDFRATGPLGGSFAPFVPGEGGAFQDDIKLDLPLDRIVDRKRLLSQVDQLRARLDGDHRSAASVGAYQTQAFDMLLGGVARAFDLSREDARTIARYDTEPLVDPKSIREKWNNHKNYKDNAKSLGKLMLLARRLCESGCGFVTVTTNFVWDMHADVNNATMSEGMSYLGGPLDYAVSAFLEDVAARGLSDKILLVMCGEMGRTPKLNNRGGRDHWGRLAPLLLAGGGLKMGQVIGKSDSQAAAPATEPITIRNLLATIMHTAFDVGELRVQRGLPREITQEMTGWQPISELM